ncbi:MAG: glycosyl hydrolase [Breznakibacter sp.]
MVSGKAMRNPFLGVLCVLMGMTLGCRPQSTVLQAPTGLSRTPETEALFANLKKIVANGQIMFGQANPTTISYLGTNKKTDISQSDCKDLVGSHPAFYESDFMWYVGRPDFRKRDMQAMREAYRRGAVLGYCWHLGGKDSRAFYARRNDKKSADSLLVKNILSNPDRNANPSLNWLLTQLDTLVVPVFKELGFPLVFRPWHEMNGEWFYWGSDNCTPAEYIRLYRLTVDYIRSQGVDNVLFAWSPDKEASMRYYPGDAYVDIMGLDIYEPGIMEYSNHPKILRELGIITDYAYTHGKVAAITEIGCRKTDGGEFHYPDQYPDFWTNYVLEPVLGDAKAKRLAWIMSWYAANWHGDESDGPYIPYVGMKRPRTRDALADFKAFFDHPATLFENDLPNMYK